MRIGAAELAGIFVSTNRNVDMEEQIPTLVQLLLGLFADSDERVCGCQLSPQRSLNVP